MFDKLHHGLWSHCALAIVFTVMALACGIGCHDADDCHADTAAATACCVCLCCHAMDLPGGQLANNCMNIPCGAAACEFFLHAVLLPADIFRPPAG